MTAPWLMCYASSLRPWRCPYLFVFFRDWDCEAFTYLSPLIWDFLYGHVDDVTAGRSSLCSGSVVCSRSRAALVLLLGLVPGGFRSLGIFVWGCCTRLQPLAVPPFGFVVCFIGFRRSHLFSDVDIVMLQSTFVIFILFKPSDLLIRQDALALLESMLPVLRAALTIFYFNRLARASGG